ncbi:MAG: hypothetical protein HKN08_07310 [Gammaproteobacteria bacterium]|nr:hypothetical protein [Gammaproteobacteria bacterium]
MTPQQDSMDSQTAPEVTSNTEPPEPSPDLLQVINALTWLGNKSLDEFRLTYPPRDNAYYYFNRMLELDPGNQSAINGILNIANQYAVLAEQAMVNNELEKTASYVDIGLRIDPNNQALLGLRQFVQSNKSGFINTIKSFFSG